MLILVGVVFSWAGILTTHRSFIFDDSFITYRYAKNLANGYGITWNPGEDPVEGYTNFLLVVGLAPFIRAGLDPLVVTRILSVMGAIGIAWLCALFAARYYDAKRTVMLLVFLAALPAGKAFYLSTVGLETLIFTFFLFLSFYHATRFIDNAQITSVAFFGLAQLCAFLLRPEGLILAFLFCAYLLIHRQRIKGHVTKVAGALLVFLFLPLIVYLTWKIFHFGAILPNPFYVKVANAEGLFSKMGINSVIGYLFESRHLVVVGLLSLLLFPCKHSSVVLCSLFCLCHLLFFAQTDTLMDIHSRFIYPVTPFFFFLALPVIARLMEQVFNSSATWPIKIPVAFLVFMLVFVADPKNTLWEIRDVFRGIDKFAESQSLMQKEYRVARRLALYDNIRDVRIKIGEYVVIPYFNEAYVIDSVGLNDNFIAREKDIGRLTDYLFSKRLDLLFMPATKQHSWITYGHGPMGDVTRWSSDPRLDEYKYVGTITFERGYDYHLLLRKDYAEFDRLSSFLEQYIVDVVYDPFPMPFGTRARGAAGGL